MLIGTDPINDNDDKGRFDEPFIEMIICYYFVFKSTWVVNGKMIIDCKISFRMLNI